MRWRCEVPGGEEDRSLRTAETTACPSSPPELGLLHLPSPFRMLEQYPGICHLYLFSWSKMLGRSDRQDPPVRPGYDQCDPHLQQPQEATALQVPPAVRWRFTAANHQGHIPFGIQERCKCLQCPPMDPSQYCLTDAIPRQAGTALAFALHSSPLQTYLDSFSGEIHLTLPRCMCDLPS